MSLKKDEINYKKANRLLFILILISLILIFAHLTPTIKAIKYLAFSIISPSLEFASNTFMITDNLMYNVSNILNVNRENIELKKQISELNYKLTDFELLEEENIRLKNLLLLSQKKDKKRILANIITREPSQWYQWVLINKGSSEILSRSFVIIREFQKYTIVWIDGTDTKNINTTITPFSERSPLRKKSSIPLKTRERKSATR